MKAKRSICRGAISQREREKAKSSAGMTSISSGIVSEAARGYRRIGVAAHHQYVLSSAWHDLTHIITCLHSYFEENT